MMQRIKTLLYYNTQFFRSQRCILRNRTSSVCPVLTVKPDGFAFRLSRGTRFAFELTSPLEHDNWNNLTESRQWVV
jgi:hypothetical protein